MLVLMMDQNLNKKKNNEKNDFVFLREERVLSLIVQFMAYGHRIPYIDGT